MDISILDSLREYRMLVFLVLTTIGVSLLLAMWTTEVPPLSPVTLNQATPDAGTNAPFSPWRLVAKSFASRLESARWWGNYLHITLPALVLVIEAYTLKRMLVEQSERKKTDEALKAFRASLGRQNYLDQIASAISSAEEDVVFTTSTMEASWHSNDQKRIFNAVLDRFKRADVEKSTHSAAPVESETFEMIFRHRGIVAKKPGTLPGTIELLCLTGVEIRMSPVLAMSRLRFLVQDNRRSILGIAEGPSELAREKPSSISFAVDSTMLALALRKRFEELWETSSDPWEYLSEFIKESKKADPKRTQESILKWLRADKSNLKGIHQALLQKCPAYESLPKAPEQVFR